MVSTGTAVMGLGVVGSGVVAVGAGEGLAVATVGRAVATGETGGPFIKLTPVNLSSFFRSRRCFPSTTAPSASNRSKRCIIVGDIW